MRAALQNHVGQSAAATGVNQSSVPQIINIHKWPGVTSAQHLDPTRTHRRSRIWRLIFMKGLKDTANTGAGTTYLTLCMCLCVCLNVISHTLSLETNTGSYSFVKLLKQIIKVSTAGIAPGTEESNRNVIPNKDLYGMCFYCGD